MSAGVEQAPTPPTVPSKGPPPPPLASSTRLSPITEGSIRSLHPSSTTRIDQVVRMMFSVLSAAPCRSNSNSLLLSCSKEESSCLHRWTFPGGARAGHAPAATASLAGHTHCPLPTTPDAQPIRELREQQCVGWQRPHRTRFPSCATAGRGRATGGGRRWDSPKDKCQSVGGASQQPFCQPITEPHCSHCKF